MENFKQAEWYPAASGSHDSFSVMTSLFHACPAHDEGAVGTVQSRRGGHIRPQVWEPSVKGADRIGSPGRVRNRPRRTLEAVTLGVATAGEGNTHGHA